MKPAAERAGLVLFGLFLAAAAGEIALRVYSAVAPDPPGSAYVRDRHAGYRLRPDPPEQVRSPESDHINALGFRDREHPIEKPRGAYRILGIGDSFVYGAVPLEQNFLRVAEACLAPVFQPDSLQVEMVLMGVGGYTPENELGLFKSLGLDLDPDHLVLNFFVGNDVGGLCMRGEVWHGRVYYVGSPVWWRNLLRQSKLFVLSEKVFLTRIKLAWQMARFEKKARSVRGAAGPGAARDSAGAGPDSSAGPGAAVDLSPVYLRIQDQRLPVFEVNPPGFMEALWRRAERSLIEFDRVCRERGVSWTLLVIPDELQVDPEVRDALLRALGRPASRYDFDAPQRRIAAFAERHGIPVLDLLPAMRAAHRPGDRLYKPNDTHWNERGNLLAGETLAERLARDLAGRGRP